jgi:ParB/RepB/Spo0J family partition protein
LDAIVPSRTQVQSERRRHFDANGLKELTASIRDIGVVQPIVVRRLPEGEGGVHFEIVAGERRWRAAQDAGLAEIPAVVRTLSDQDVLQIQLVENLQREGLDELTEAEGYEELMKTGFTVDEIATKLVKSRQYVYQRLKLLALCSEGRKAFRDGTLSAAIALMVARIPVESLQKEALKEVTRKGWDGDLPSLREAQSIILNRFMLRLSEAPFSTADAELVPQAGACRTCPKRTGNQPELFGDVKRADTCTDPTCFATKKAAHQAKRREEALAQGRPVLDGEAAAKIMRRGVYDLKGYVHLDSECYADEKRRTYRKILGKQCPPGSLILDETRGTYIEIAPTDEVHALLKSKGIKTSHEQLKSQDESRKDAEKKARRETAFRTYLMQQVRDRAPTSADVELLRAVAETLYTTLWYEHRKRLARLYRWKQPKKDGSQAPADPWGFMASDSMADVVKFLLDCTLINELQVSPHQPSKAPRLMAAAARAGLDVAALRKSFDPDAHAAELKKRDAPARPKAAAKRRTAPANGE